jgi:transposase
MAYWAKAPAPREQLVLFATRLDDVLGEDHPVRLLDDILAAVDWSDWERYYCGLAGQPAIHPRVLAGAILYGLTVGVRTSRKLEDACRHRVDFMWLVEGRTIDHSTFAGFRKDFGRQIKDLFKQVGRLAMTMGLVRLNTVALDGTRVRANADRRATATAKTLEGRLARLDEEIERLLAEAGQAEEAEQRLFAGVESAGRLPRALADAKRRQEALGRALAAARAADAHRAARGESKKGAVTVPVADPDAVVMPNKEGGHAPNYGPVVAVDAASGVIVDADVLAESNEGGATLPTVARIEATFGEKPRQLLADGNHGTGANLEALEAAGVEAFIPVEGGRTAEAVRRADGHQPVPESAWPDLPRSPQTKRLDKAAFLYDKERDCYWCPTGRRLGFSHAMEQARAGGPAACRVYVCHECTGCPLAAACIAKNGTRRTVMRDQHEERREAMQARLATEAGKAAYRRRAPLVEGVIGVVKSVLGFRQFLLRGLEHVKTEWFWLCTAFNLRKVMAALRAATATGGL